MTDLSDDIEGARPFEDDYELAHPVVTFNPMKEGDPWDGATPVSSTAAGTSETWTPAYATNTEEDDKT